MCANFGRGPPVVSKKRGVQTDRQRHTAALYSRSILQKEEKMKYTVIMMVLIVVQPTMQIASM